MSSNREIVGIQYLRGVAACAVVFDHAASMATFDKYYGVELWGGWLQKGAIGVDLFFMISGFIIAIVSLGPQTLDRRIGLAEFAARRFSRIVPLMWVAILSYAALRFLGRGVFDPIPYLKALILWPVGSVDPKIIWTLRHEAIFYTVFALTFLGSKWLRPLMILWVISPLFLFVEGGFDQSASQWGQVQQIIMSPANLEFGVGLAIGMVWLKWTRSFGFEFPFLWPVSVVYMLVSMGLANLINIQVNRIPDTIICSLIFIPVLMLCIHAKAKGSSLGLLLGNASFSIYLFHSHFVSALLGLSSKVAATLPVWITVPILALCSIGLSILVYLIVEKPITRIAARFLLKGPRGQTSSKPF